MACDELTGVSGIFTRQNSASAVSLDFEPDTDYKFVETLEDRYKCAYCHSVPPWWVVLCAVSSEVLTRRSNTWVTFLYLRKHGCGRRAVLLYTSCRYKCPLNAKLQEVKTWAAWGLRLFAQQYCKIEGTRGRSHGLWLLELETDVAVFFLLEN